MWPFAGDIKLVRKSVPRPARRRRSLIAGPYCGGTGFGPELPSDELNKFRVYRDTWTVLRESSEGVTEMTSGWGAACHHRDRPISLAATPAAHTGPSRW
jgi:hypothetical protein